MCYENVCSGRWAPNSRTNLQPTSEQNSNVQMKAGVFSQSPIPTYYQAIRRYYPEFCNLNSDRCKKSKSLGFFLGAPMFYLTGPACLTNYKNHACRSILTVCILINVKVTRHVKHHISMFVSKVFHIDVASARISDLFPDRAMQSH